MKPAPEFIYYEVASGSKLIGVIRIMPTGKRPHIISVDFGKIRSGQIPVRRGSSTAGVTREDLFEMFYKEASGARRLQLQQLYRTVELIRDNALQLYVSDEQIKDRVSAITFDLNVFEPALHDPFCPINQEPTLVQDINWLKRQCSSVNNMLEQYKLDILSSVTVDNRRAIKEKHNINVRIFWSQIQNACSGILRSLQQLIEFEQNNVSN